MVTYSEAIIQSNRIAHEIHQMDEQLKTIYQGIQHAEQTLAGMESKYGPFVSDVNQKDVNDPEWAAMQGKLAKLVDDFATLKTYATAVRQAIENVQ